MMKVSCKADKHGFVLVSFNTKWSINRHAEIVVASEVAYFFYFNLIIMELSTSDRSGGYAINDIAALSNPDLGIFP